MHATILLHDRRYLLLVKNCLSVAPRDSFSELVVSDASIFCIRFSHQQVNKRFAAMFAKEATEVVSRYVAWRGVYHSSTVRGLMRH